MLDLSQKPAMANAAHWHDEINQLYHPTGTYGQEMQDAVYSKDAINSTKFAPILLKEWFFLVKKGGYLIIDYRPNAMCDWKKLEKYMWWLWKSKYEIIYHGPIPLGEHENVDKEKVLKFILDQEKYYRTNLDKKTHLPPLVSTKKTPADKDGYLRFVCKRTNQTKISGDSIDKWTFGIVTNGKRNEWIERIIGAIQEQKIPHYEIIVCGTYHDRKENNTRYIPFNKRDDLGWITRKKNLIVEAAKYENLCVIHDRLIPDKNWYKGMIKWGNCFEHLGCVQEKDGLRATDWHFHEKMEHEEFSFLSLLDYRDWDVNVFQGGQMHILKRTYAKECPWDETCAWNDLEDVRLGEVLNNRGHILRFNPHSRMDALDYRFGEIPSVPFDPAKLSSQRRGSLTRILPRWAYRFLCRNRKIRALVRYAFRKLKK